MKAQQLAVFIKAARDRSRASFQQELQYEILLKDGILTERMVSGGLNGIEENCESYQRYRGR